MGTWSVKPFGNDTALDWLNDLQEADDGGMYISNTVDAILNDYDGCSIKAEEALAAISIISAATTNPVKGTIQEAKIWINENCYVPPYSLINNAITALDIITATSELYDLWQGSDSLKSWINNTNKIKNTLIQSKHINLPLRLPNKKRTPRTLYKLVEYYNSNPDEKIRSKIFEKVQAIKNVNQPNSETNYDLPLSLLSKYGLLEEVEYLLQKGADPNAQPMFFNLTCSQAFSLACINGHIRVADVLLNAGAIIFGETVMNEDTGNRYYPELYKDNIESPRLKTYKYCVSLFSAASQGTPEIIDYLLSKGANIHQLDLNGETLIHKACRVNNIPTLEHLIKLGVDLNASKGIINGNKDSRGETALHYAVSNNFPKAVRLLLDNGANPNVVEYFNGTTHKWKNTPLDLVIDKKDSEIYQLLREHGGLLAEELDE